MVKAINQLGTIKVFSDVVWKLLGTNKHGWQEYSEGNDTIKVPLEIKEFQTKIQEESELIKEFVPKEVTSTYSPSDAAASMDIMKEHLTSKGIKFHPLIGYDKLKAKYNANNK